MATSARALWTGAIRFGLVDFPVKLHTAVRSQDIHFHLLHDQDGVRVTQEMVCPVHKRPVPREHMLKGFEIDENRYVIMDDEEMEKCAPESSKTIEITEFVDLADVDPMYFEKAYWIGPDKGGDKSYRLTVETLNRTKKAGIGRLVMRRKEYLACLRASFDETLCLQTMHFHDEVVPQNELDWEVKQLKRKLDEREVKMAQSLITALEGKFQPEKYRDEFRACVMKMIERKAKGEEIEIHKPKKRETTKDSSLLKVLESSVAAARKRAAAGNN
jgi:DNA end-binding protein Ku